MGREEKDGLLVLSKQRVDGIKMWQKIDKSFEDGSPVEGTIASRGEGRFHRGHRRQRLSPYISGGHQAGQESGLFHRRHLKFKVIKVNQKKGNVIVSRRMLLEEERDRKRRSSGGT